jgi:hypothetical protein
MPVNDNIAMSTILAFASQLLIASNCDVNVSLTVTVVHDGPRNIVSGRTEQNKMVEQLLFAINWTGTELNNDVLDKLKKSSTQINTLLDVLLY